MPSKSASKKATRRQNRTRISAPQPRTYQGRFGSLSKQKNDSYELELALRSSSVDLAALDNLEEDSSNTDDDKKERMRALYARWKYEDTERVLDGAALQTRQRSRVKEVGLIVFGFKLHEEQIEAIWTLYSEQRDLLLLAKTGFGKSLIFQLLPFMTPLTGVVVVLMPLKLLQAEQCETINRLPGGKAIVLNGDNNHLKVRTSIARRNYTHVFTSPEIAVSRNFKDHVLNQPGFMNRLSLLAVDEIHLVNEWGQSFRPLYAEIEKVRKRIPHYVPLLGVSATLTAKVRSQVLQKAGFTPNYRLMQTSLDRPEIMQIHRFMEHPRASCLDLQFVLPDVIPDVAMQAKNIQKTIIFVNSVAEIIPMISIFEDWMKIKGYPEHASRWIRPYNATISDWTKGLTSKAFGTPQEDNTDCTILVATDAYGMGIDNPDVKLVIQWDIPKSFDSMIQRMGRAGRKGAQSTFVFFSPKWSRIDDDSDEIERRLASNNPSTARAQAANLLRASIAKPSLLSQVVDADEDVSDSESVAESAVSESDAAFDLDDADDADLISSLLATEADENQMKAKKKSQASRTHADKRAKLPDEIYHYIHVAQCRRLYALEWYDDVTYAPNQDGSKKPLPSLCCNGPGCLSPEPDFMQRAPFIDTTPLKLTEVDREWTACRFAALRKWRTETAAAEWLEAGIDPDEEMFDTFIMTDECLSTLASRGGSFNYNQLVEFLSPFGVDEYAASILICLQKNRPALNDETLPGFELPSKAERKAALKDLRVSKKTKHLDDPVAAEEAAKTRERDIWADSLGKASLAAQARLKKVARAEKKLLDKQEQYWAKAKKKTQGLERLALNNSRSQAQYGTFKAVLSDPVMPGDVSAPENAPVPSQASKICSARLSRMKSKDSAASRLAANRLKIQTTQQDDTESRPSTPPPSVVMELERPSSKRKARLTAKGVENTPSKRMRPSGD